MSDDPDEADGCADDKKPPAPSPQKPNFYRPFNPPSENGPPPKDSSS